MFYYITKNNLLHYKGFVQRRLYETNIFRRFNSHVNELKERMEKQIVVEKEKNGSRILPFELPLS